MLSEQCRHIFFWESILSCVYNADQSSNGKRGFFFYKRETFVPRRLDRDSAQLPNLNRLVSGVELLEVPRPVPYRTSGEIIRESMYTVCKNIIEPLQSLGGGGLPCC